MAEEKKPDLPNMDGYLGYKNRVADGDAALERQAHAAWRDNLFKEKPAIVHYQDALGHERAMERMDTQQSNARNAIDVGDKMHELRQTNPTATENELLFQAKVEVDRERHSREIKARELAERSKIRKKVLDNTYNIVKDPIKDYDLDR